MKPFEPVFAGRVEPARLVSSVTTKAMPRSTQALTNDADGASPPASSVTACIERSSNQTPPEEQPAQGEPAMETSDPIVSTILTMTTAFQVGDIPAILRAYEPGAVVIGEPGKPLTGEAALRAMFAGFIAVKPKFTYAGHDVVIADDLALHLAPWQMDGVAPDGTAVKQNGLSVAVLRRQPDGRWLMVIDQPYGDALLNQDARDAPMR